MPKYLFNPKSPNTEACSKPSREGLGKNMKRGETHELSDTWAEFLNSIIPGSGGDGQALIPVEAAEPILCSEPKTLETTTAIPPVTVSTPGVARGRGRPAKKPS